jgi:fermentation-respiration switch protein FrsA (DUF1100 family)
MRSWPATACSGTAVTERPPPPPSRPIFSRKVLSILAAVLLLLGAGAASLHSWARSRELVDVFAPAGPIADDPGRHGLAWAKVALTAEDGEAVTAWLLPGAGPATVLWLHGNAVNMGDVIDRVEPLVRRFGATVLLVDYRGYGESSRARPTEQGLYLDAEAAWKHLTRVKGVDPRRIVLYGHSLGGGVAAEMAVRHGGAGLVLESTFTSIPAMGKRSYPYLPVELLVESRFDNLAKVEKLSLPLLVIHGDADPKVPLEMGLELFAAAPGPRELMVLPGAVHSNCYKAGGESYWQAWERMLAVTNPPSP